MKITKSFIYLLVLVFVGFIALNYALNIKNSKNLPTENSFEQNIASSSTNLYKNFSFFDLNLIIADTTEKLTRGLGGRESLNENEAMLFVFEKPYRWGIWMEDMKFSIDIIWLDESFSVVDLKNDVSPTSYPKIYYPQKPAKYVIEVNSGFIKDKKLFIGQKVFATSYPQPPTKSN